MAEYDNIGYFPEARINAGLRFNLTDAIDLDFMMRDCWGKDSPDKVPNERVFKISYTRKILKRIFYRMDRSFDFEQPIAEVEKKIENLKDSSSEGGIDFSEQIADLEKKRDLLKQKIYGSLTPWQRIQIARHPSRLIRLII